MAGSPRFKVYRGDEYVGCTKYAEDAAALVAHGDEGTIRIGHRKADTLWTEGRERFQAGESFDRVAEVVYDRLHRLRGDPAPDCET